MALIPRYFLNTVVALGVPDSKGAVNFTATGFLWGYEPADDHGEKGYWVFLVTNRHVVEGKSKLMVRFNAPVGATPKTFPLPVGDSVGAIHWTFHPDPDVDVAVLLIDAIGEQFEGVQMSFMTPLQIGSVEMLRKIDFSEGTEVIVLGFPMGLAGKEQNYVIARQGIIARIGDLLDGHSKSFLIDSSIYPGNSGGPVIAKPTLFTIRGGDTLPHAKLIGMVSAYLPYEDIAYSLQTNPPTPRVSFQENSGLARVIPVDAIQETISFAASRYPTSPAPPESTDDSE